MTASQGRVLVVGWDGATFALLQRLLDAGRLPHLASFQARGSWQTLLSTIPPVTAPAWATFMTGKNPGQHGVFNFFRRDPSGYAYEETAGFVDNRSVHGAALWDVAGQAGLRVGIVNVPLTYPPRPVNGFLISGMLTPPSAQQFTYPPELAETLPNYAIDLDHVRGEQGWSSSQAPVGKELVADVTLLLDKRASHVKRLMQEWEWDLFVVVFVGTDRLFHPLWAHLVADGESDPIHDQCLAYLERLDTVLGDMRALAGPQATTLVISDHGFGPAPTRRLNLNEWLRELGLVTVDTSSRRLIDPGYWATQLGLRRPSVRRWLERILPKQRLRQLAYREGGSKTIPADWSKTRANAVQLYNQYCGIEINRAGHKQQGIVAHDDDYEALRDSLLRQLAQLRDPATGQAPVQNAWRREDVYKGPYLETAPDLIVELLPDYAGLAPLGTGAIVTPFHSDRAGDHQREGIFLATGPVIAQGRLPTEPQLADLAPTILYLLGLPVPEDMDGQVIEAAIDPVYLAAHRPQRGPAVAVATTNPDEGLTENEMKEIQERLKGLGYLG
jgi:predicted AlkP superfamily phosphohydrolase/phosphomutase